MFQALHSTGTITSWYVDTAGAATGAVREFAEFNSERTSRGSQCFTMIVDRLVEKERADVR